MHYSETISDWDEFFKIQNKAWRLAEKTQRVGSNPAQKEKSSNRHLLLPQTVRLLSFQHDGQKQKEERFRQNGKIQDQHQRLRHKSSQIQPCAVMAR